MHRNNKALNSVIVSNHFARKQRKEEKKCQTMETTEKILKEI